MRGSGCICLPTSGHLGQSGGEVIGLPMQQNHSDCSRVAQHALVLGSSGHVQPNPTEPTHSAQPADAALQSDPSQKSDKSIYPCKAPRASAIKEQGSQNRGSSKGINQVSLSGASQIRWTSGHPL